MILLIGNSNEEVIDYVALLLQDRGLPFLLLDPNTHGKSFEFDWEVRGGRSCGELRYGQSRLPLSDVQSVFARDIYRTKFDPMVADPGRMLYAFVESAPILMVNRFSACATNFSKAYQQQIIAAHGIATPKTLITTVPDAAREFYEQCDRRVIYKSISSMRSIVRKMTDADLERLDHLKNCPTQFQEWVPGTDVRVHVIGRELFVTDIETDSIDYRYAGRDGTQRTMRPSELPPDLAERVLKLCKSLDLVIAGVDFRRSVDGTYVCLEANPNPGFTFYEQYTGQGIGNALVDLLSYKIAA